MANEKKVGLEVVISATDNATKKFKEINKKLANSGLARLNNSFRQLSQASGITKVGKGMKNFGDATSKAANEFSGLILKLGALAGVGGGGLFALTKGFSDFADNAKDSADRLGTTVGKYQQFSIAAGLAGVDQEIFNGSLDKFSKNIGEAALNGGGMAKMLTRLGVSLKDTATGKMKTFDQLLPDVVQKLNGITNASKRNAVGMKLFGKQFGQLLPLIQDFDKFTSQAGGFVISDEEIERGDKFQNQMKGFTALLTNLRNIAGSAMLDGFTEGLEIFSTFLNENRGQIKEFFTAIGKEIPGAFRTLVSVLKSAMSFFSTFNEETGETTLNMGRLKTVIAIFAAFMAAPFVTAMASAVAALWPLIVALGELAIAFALAFPWLTALIVVAGLIWKYWEPIKTLLSEIWDFIVMIAEKWAGIFSMENIRGLSAKILGPAPVAETNYVAQGQQTNNASASLSVKFDNVPKGARINSSNQGYDSFSLERGLAMGVE